MLLVVCIYYKYCSILFLSDVFLYLKDKLCILEIILSLPCLLEYLLTMLISNLVEFEVLYLGRYNPAKIEEFEPQCLELCKWQTEDTLT